MAGRELDNLTTAALKDLVISVEEAHRIRDRYRRDVTSIRLQTCRYYETGGCRDGDDCQFVHAKPERTFKDPIFVNWEQR